MNTLAHLAFNGKTDETKLAAIIAWLDRFEGKPIARSINVSSGNAADIDDATLAALAAEYETLTSDEEV